MRRSPSFSTMETIIFHYRFRFLDGTEKDFDVTLDKETLAIVPKERGEAPPWTELGFCQCPNCPLDTAKVKHCPVAFNLVDLIDFFKTSVSHEQADVTIEAAERTYGGHVSLQKGVSSLLGIYMAAGGCPILDKMKPMVRFHLPFASLEETQYRVLSMYLLAQYFLKKGGQEADWDLKELSKISEEVHTVNKAFSKRLGSLKGKDAVPNAVAILDTFSQGVSFAIDYQALSKIEALFRAYLKK